MKMFPRILSTFSSRQAQLLVDSADYDTSLISEGVRDACAVILDSKLQESFDVIMEISITLTNTIMTFISTRLSTLVYVECPP